MEKKRVKQAFRNDYHKGIVNLIYTYGVVSNWLQQHFSDFDLTTQQFNILRILRGAYPKACTNSHIKERMLDKNSDVTRIINRLITRNLVARCSSEEDKRKVEITILDKGLRLLEQIDKVSYREDDILGNLSEDEIKELNILLEKIRKDKAYISDG